jgi:hypothetical protein
LLRAATALARSMLAGLKALGGTLMKSFEKAGNALGSLLDEAIAFFDRAAAGLKAGPVAADGPAGSYMNMMSEPKGDLVVPASARPNKVTVEELMAGKRGPIRTQPTAAKSDEFVDDAIKTLEAKEHPFQLDVSEKKLKTINAKGFQLERPIGFDIDEALAVGAEGLSEEEQLARALDLHGRQALESMTNRRTKHLGPSQAEVARQGITRPTVSLKQQPAAFIDRRFDEVEEIKELFAEVCKTVKTTKGRRATAVKAEINGKMRDIIRTGSTPAGATIKAALEKLGFELVVHNGKLMLLAVKKP